MQRWPAGLAATGVLLSVFLITLSLPIPDKAVAAKTLALAVKRAPHTTVITGNSVLSHTSRCDGDRRTLGDMLKQSLADRSVVELGAPGQHFAEAVNYLALALQKSSVDTVVFMLAPYQLAEHEWPSLQTQMFMSTQASAELEVNSFSSRFSEGYVLTGGEPGKQAFTYKGVAYPEYQGIKGYFAREKAAMSCPETLGSQREFIEAYYWFTYTARAQVASNAQDLGRLAALAKSLGKELLVVLMPADSDDVAELNPDVARAMKQKLADSAHQLESLGISLLDLTHSPSVHDFADRWCACGHLSEQGRKWVAERVSARLRRER